VRQPSVSAQNRGIREMAEMLAGDLRALGFKEVELVPTDGHPGVFGFYDAGAPRTLVVYMMYDVQPEETGWRVPPSRAQLVDHDARPRADGARRHQPEGPERAFLNAVDSIIKDARRAAGEPDGRGRGGGGARLAELPAGHRRGTRSG
jgi:hypothetical protein